MAFVEPNTSNFEFKFIRKSLRDLIELAAPLAKVHAEWKLELDGDGIGQVTNALKGKGDHSDFVHSWMIGLANETPITDENGVDRYAGGGTTTEYLLNFAVWGFYEYKGWRAKFVDGSQIAPDSANPEQIEDSNATGFAEQEHRKIKAYVRANPRLDLSSANVQARPFGVENSDVHGFSDNRRILVVQGFVPVRVRESYT